MIDALRVIPKAPFKIQPLDVLSVQVEGTGAYQPISGLFLIEPSGMLNLGPAYGKVKVGDLSLEEATEAVTKHLKRILKEPQVSLTLNESGGQQQVAGEHLVGPDGTVNLGTYGPVYVAGLTIEEARTAIEEHLKQFLEAPLVSVDVFAYNSKVYYVITEGAGFGDNIQRFPITGNETVLDAVSLVNGLSRLSSKNIWIARPSPFRLRSDPAGALGRHRQRGRHLHQLPGVARGSDLHLARSPDRLGFVHRQGAQPDGTGLRHQLAGHANHPNRPKLPGWHEQPGEQSVTWNCRAFAIARDKDRIKVEGPVWPLWTEVVAMRNWLYLILTALIALAGSKQALAQGGELPFSNVQQSPTVSPYLNLLGSRASNGLPNYQTLVQPILQQQQQAAQQQSQIQRLQQGQQSLLSRGAGLANPARGASSAIRGTGHVTAFMDTSHYYPRFQQGRPPQ